MGPAGGFPSVPKPVRKLLWSTGKAAWIAGTTLLVLFVPLVIEMDREQQLAEMESSAQGVLAGPGTAPAPAKMAAAASAAVAVYRALLRAHRTHLPPPMRPLGDAYAKTEWRAIAGKHREGAVTEAQWAEFLAQWREYTTTLVGSSSPAAEPASGDLSPEQLDALSPAQKEQLARLRDEAVRAARDE